MFIFLFFITLKINLTNASPKIKNKVTNKVIGLTGTPIANINDEIVTLPLLNKIKTKQYKKTQDSFFSHFSPIKKVFALQWHVAVNC